MAARRLGVAGPAALLALVAWGAWGVLAPNNGSPGLDFTGVEYLEAADRVALALGRDVIVDVSGSLPTLGLPGGRVTVDEALDALRLDPIVPTRWPVLLLAGRPEWRTVGDGEAPTKPFALPPRTLRWLVAGLRRGEPARTSEQRAVVRQLAQRRLADQAEAYRHAARPAAIAGARLRYIRPRGGRGDRFLQAQFPSGTLIAWPAEPRPLATQPVSAIGLHLTNVPLATAFAAVAAPTGLPVEVQADSTQGRRVILRLDHADAETGLRALADLFGLRITRTSNAWIIHPRPERSYELQSARLIQQSQQFTWRRLREFHSLVTQDERRAMEQESGLVFRRLSRGPREALRQALEARFRVNAAVAVSLMQQADLGDGSVTFRSGSRIAPLLRFRGRNVSLVDLMPYVLQEPVRP